MAPAKSAGSQLSKSFPKRRSGRFNNDETRRLNIVLINIEIGNPTKPEITGMIKLVPNCTNAGSTLFSNAWTGSLNKMSLKNLPISPARVMNPLINVELSRFNGFKRFPRTFKITLPNADKPLIKSPIVPRTFEIVLIAERMPESKLAGNEVRNDNTPAIICGKIDPKIAPATEPRIPNGKPRIVKINPLIICAGSVLSNGATKTFHKVLINVPGSDNVLINERIGNTTSLAITRNRFSNGNPIQSG